MLLNPIKVNPVGNSTLYIFLSFQFLGNLKSYGRICLVPLILKFGRIAYVYPLCSFLKGDLGSDTNNPALFSYALLRIALY